MIFSNIIVNIMSLHFLWSPTTPNPQCPGSGDGKVLAKTETTILNGLKKDCIKNIFLILNNL
jgi:hypothetical protein